MSLHAHISDTPFDEMSLQPPEEGILNCHRQTDRHTNIQTDMATL